MNRLLFSIPLPTFSGFTISIFLFFFSFSAAAQCGCTDCRCSDSLALVALYNSTGGANWTNNTGWKLTDRTTMPMSSWYGLTLRNGRVYCIDLDGGIVNCAFDGGGNNLIGVLPDSLRILTNLEILILSYNQINGSIPASINSLSNLGILRVNSNRLSGNIPSFNLPKLSDLSLSNNQLSGNIPNFNLPNLHLLQLNDNQLSGNIPNFNLPNLERLALSGNQLSGTIPNFNLPNLQYIWFHNNKLSGVIPNFNLPMLGILYLQGNQLSGIIPNFNLPNLNDFRISTNKFTFDGALSPIQQGTKTPVNFNNYAPQDSIFKDTTYQLTEGSNLTINLGIDDTVTTNIYKWYKNGTLYQTINGNNKLTFNNIQQTDAGVYTCQVTNPNAPLLTLYSRKATVVVAQSCRSRDSLALVALYNATGGPNWTRRDNWLTSSPISTWYGIQTDANGCVTCIDLDGNATCNSNGSGNNLIGSIPASIDSLKNVTSLFLTNNHLSGTVPNFNLPNLVFLHLRANSLSGSIPNFNCPNLLILDLQNNQLTDSIPNFNFPNLYYIWLNGNQLTGTIPNFNLPNLQQLDLSYNQLSGTIPNFNLPNLAWLALGSNQLSGTIPNFNLPNLQYLYLYSNQLSGTIPNFNLPNLQYLSLYSNQLSGNIPNFNMPNLQYLSLYSNQLSGNIPNFNLPNLQQLYLNSNQFTFTGILSPILQGTKTSVNFGQYTPQDSIFKDTTYQLTVGGNLTINLGIDDTVTTNVYKWYKNGTLYQTINGNNKLIFNNIQLTDAGVYTCQVTNPNAPLLTLYSRKATVVVNRLCIVTIGAGQNRRLLIDSISCFGGTSPNINFAFSSGVQPLTYKIDTFIQVLDPVFRNKIKAGRHTAIVTDGEGCSDTLIFYIGQPSQLSASFSSVIQPTCITDKGSMALNSNLGGTPPYKYAWSNGSTASSITNLSLGTYSVTVTDNNTCVASNSATISNSISNNPSTITMRNGTICSDICGSSFFDSGGAGGNYGNNESFTITFYSSDPVNKHIAIGFNDLDIAMGDELCFFDGSDVNAPSLGCASDFNNNRNPIVETTARNTNGCMTIRFMSNATGTGRGWFTNILCVRNCQTLKGQIVSSSPSIVPADTGWIDVCLNTPISLSARGIYPYNDIAYHQSDNLSKFEWDFGDATAVAYGTNVTHTYTQSGGVKIRLTITDTLGCRNTNLIEQRIRVPSRPDFKIGSIPQNVCPNTQIKLKTKVQQIDTSYSLSFRTKTDSFPISQRGGGQIFIPDNQRDQFSTSLFFSDFNFGQTLQNASDLKRIFVNMEHSWARDLDIKIVCPNLQQAILHKYAGQSSTFKEIRIGIPRSNRYQPGSDGTGVNQNNPAFNPPGTGLEYGWTNTGTRTWGSFTNTVPISLPPGDYLPEESLSRLLGCPLNGEWKIVLKDQWAGDNGWIFKWGIEFDKSIYPNIETFTPLVTEHRWLDNNSIIQNFGDSILVKVPNTDSLSLAYRVKNNFGCVFDTSIVLRILNNPTNITKDTSLCSGKTYTLPNGQIITNSTIYRDTLRSQNNCDSIIRVTNINFLSTATTTTQTPVLCNGQTYTLPNGQIVSTATNYRDTARTLNGCDSLIRIINVTTGSNPTTKTLNASICRGQSYTLPNGQIVTPSVNTTYLDTLKSISGCDSLRRTTIVNVSAPTVLPTQNAAICRGQSYPLPSGRIVSPSTTTTFSDTIRGRTGCDSLIRAVNLTVNQPTERPLSISICSGQNHTLPKGRIVSVSGIYRDTFRSVGGCDSVVVTTLTVNPPTETPLTATICSGQTHLLPSNKRVSISGIYRDTFKNAQGCNTVIVTTLTVTPPIVTPLSINLFEGDSFRFKGRIILTSGVFRDSFRTSGGCDSIVEANVSFKPIVIDESCLEEIKKTIPNAFSPNEDGDNELFDPQLYFDAVGCPPNLKAERLLIVNQWGEIIWEANPYRAWNGHSGKHQKPVPESAYFYVLVLRVNGKDRMIRGAINVFTDK